MASQEGRTVLPVVEEGLRVEKDEVVTGKVRVSTAVEQVEEVARLALDEDHVEVTRVPVGREVASAPALRTEGDVLIVPLLEEVMVVEKRLVLKEELHIRRSVATEVVEVPVTLRKQRGVVERVGAGPDSRVEAEEETA